MNEILNRWMILLSQPSPIADIVIQGFCSPALNIDCMTWKGENYRRIYWGTDRQTFATTELQLWFKVLVARHATPRYATKRILIKVASHRTSFESNKDDWLVDYIMYHSHVFLFYSFLNAFSALNARVVLIMIVYTGFWRGERGRGSLLLCIYIICMCDNFQRESDFLSLLEIVVVAYCVLFARLYQLHNNCIMNGLTFVDLEEIKHHYHSNMVILNLNWNLLLFISGCICEYEKTLNTF